MALINKKPGPRTKSVRTDLVKNLVIRYKFLDQAQSSEVIAQKLRQDGHKISCSSVRRILAEFGLEKKLYKQPPPQEQQQVHHQVSKRRKASIPMTCSTNERRFRQQLTQRVSGTHLGLMLL